MRLAIAMVALLPVTVLAQPYEPATQEVLSCLLEPSRRVLVASAVPGIARRVAFERGDMVDLGAVLLELNGDAERAALTLSLERAEFARRKMGRNREMTRNQLLSAQEIDDLRTEARLAELEAARARVELERRTTLSPLTGIIVERRVAQGEYVTSEPFAEMIALDPLYAEVTLRAEAYGRVRVGMQASIALAAPVGQNSQGQVSIVDRAIDSSSGSFRMRVVIANPGLAIPSGTACRILAVAEAPSLSVPTAGRQTTSVAPAEGTAAERLAVVVPQAGTPEPPAPVAAANTGGRTERAALPPLPVQPGRWSTRFRSIVRAAASATAEIVTVIPPDRVLVEYSRVPGWVLIGETVPIGWIAASLLQRAE
jgi:RND family efflux transporter MFP subunit